MRCSMLALMCVPSLSFTTLLGCKAPSLNNKLAVPLYPSSIQSYRAGKGPHLAAL